MLALARADAEKIDVGAAAPRPLDQDAISLLLVEKAREGKTVVRLKWGDPFVFDSGGKEALFLHEQGIPFEVIPGIPSGIGAPAYAGIPVTYPDAGDVLTLVRGHEAESDTPPKVDWARLAVIDGTLVCHAGRNRSARSRARCSSTDGRATKRRRSSTTERRRHSKPWSRRWGPSRSAHASKEAAGILIVGRVAGLREHLRWFDERPLFGRRIVVTRSREQAAELVEMLEDLRRRRDSGADHPDRAA